MTKEAIKQALRMFCAKEHEIRPALHNPFSKDGYTWATNGHMMIRVDLMDEIAEHPTAPNVTKVFNDAFDGSNMRKLNHEGFSYEEMETECTACDGRGTEHDCPDCTCECEYCNGSGVCVQKTSVYVGKALFNASYIKTLLSLPNIVVQSDPDPMKPMPFSFDGGCGLLLPLRSRYKNHLEVKL